MRTKSAFLVAVGSLSLLGLLESPVAYAGEVKLLKQPGTFPLVIAASGSYRLKSNIVVPDADTTAISITADDVTLDLNGYTISGPTVCSGEPVSCAPTGSGIGVSSSADGITIGNGTIRGMGSRGIRLDGRNAIVERIRARSNGGGGIHVNDAGCRISRNLIADSQSTGIVASASCIVTENVVRSNTGDGIDVGNGSVVTNNSIGGNVGSGITSFGANVIVIGNTIVENGDTGIEGAAGTMSSNVIVANATGGIVGEGVISNNFLDGNGTEGIAANGLVTGNVVNGSGFEGLALAAGDGFSNNVLTMNNGGNGNPQVANGIEIAGNVCGADMTCP